MRNHRLKKDSLYLTEEEPMEPSSNTPKSILIHQDHERRLTRIEVVIEHINTTLQDIKTMGIEIRQHIRRLDMKIDSNFKCLLTLILGTSASILGVIAYVQHWI